MNLRICIISNYTHALDEGMAKVAYYLYQHLSNTNNVLHVSNKELVTKKGLSVMRDFKPDIIHHVPGPSFRGLFLAVTLKKIFGSNLVISALRPQIPFFPSRFLTTMSRPDLVLVQSFKSEAMFRNLGCKTRFLPNGVDLQKFSPVDLYLKRKIRRKYGLDPDEFIVLHVGPIRRDRNVAALVKLARDKSIRVVMIGSTTTPSERDVYQELLHSGCVVWKEYFKRIEEVYWMSDVYVFPTFKDINCIEIPLSVLEAMSCNLPVVTRRYGGLSRMFTEGDGLFFVNDDMELIEKVKVAGKCEDVYTRRKVMPYSWENVCKSLESFYEETLVGNPMSD